MSITVQATGLRRSKQRDQIYAYLCQTTDHPSAEMIYAALRSSIPNLSLGTVYRNLTLLESLGQIQRVTSLGNSERYDARLDAHGHFVCTMCGAIEDLNPIDIHDVRALGGLSRKNKIHRTDITFHGCCANCAEEEAG